jgi:hypothetical protein
MTTMAVIKFMFTISTNTNHDNNNNNGTHSLREARRRLIPIVQHSVFVLPSAVQVAHDRERVGLLRKSVGVRG